MAKSQARQAEEGSTPRRGPRRANGEGSVTRRGKGWKARLVVDGKRVEFYAATKQKAYDRLHEAMRNRADNVPVILRTDTVDKFMAQWLEDKQRSWKPSAYKFNEKYARVHIVPELGHIQLQKLSPMDLQRLYARKLKTLSPTTVHHIHAVIHAALQSAVRWQVIVRNVADFIDPPRAEPAKTRPLDIEQVHRLLKDLEGDEKRPLYVVAVSTGMRQGEILALRWNDVNLPKRYINVSGTLQPDGVISEPKTAGSRRRIWLSDPALLALKGLERVGSQNERVFPYPAVNVWRHYQKRAKRLDFPSTKFHDLRHTCATLLLGENTHVKLVSDMLGHSRVQTTLDLYSHVTPEMQEQVAETMGRLLATEVA